MRNYRLTKEEMETIVLFDESSPSCEIYTCSKTVQRRLDKLCETAPDSYILTANDPPSKTYITTKRHIQFKSPRKPMTDEQKSLNKIKLEAARQKKDQA